MSPLHAAHVDSDGNIMSVLATTYTHQLNDWFRSLDFKPGDRVETAPLYVRKEAGEAPAPSAVSA